MRKHILRNGLVEYLVHYASMGLITVHNEIDPRDLEILEQIGKGASATVHRGYWKGMEVAIKMFDEVRKFFFIIDCIETSNEISKK
jgi:hypothetical protein